MYWYVRQYKTNYVIVLFVMLLAIGLMVATAAAYKQPVQKHKEQCEYWIAPSPIGDNANPDGTLTAPWATLEYASANIDDDYCTVWVKNGIYVGSNHLSSRFTTSAIFKAVNPYQASFENNGSVLNLNGVSNMVFEGFEFRHSGPDANKHVVFVDRRADLWSENVIFRNNIFHDSYYKDLLNIHNGVRFATVENNIFYNQGNFEQQVSINSVTDIVIQDNIFFNDFAGSGRSNSNTTKSFLAVKDSNGISDGLEGSERIMIRRNIFLNWEGATDSFLQVGNDGETYHEAKDVQIENNLMIGNTYNLIGAAFGVKGAKNVTFTNNTIGGDLPSKAYAFQVTIFADLNLKNENIAFYNNIWSDPTGTMGADLSGNPNEFSDGNPEDTINLVLDNNLYWNGGTLIPPGDLVSPLIDDDRHVVGDPYLNSDQSNILLPRWQGEAFLSGNATIRQEFVRLVEQYGRIPFRGPSIGLADPTYAPADDILGRERTASPDMGAYENLLTYEDLDHVFLSLITQ